jgi:hypothetical protein
MANETTTTFTQLPDWYTQYAKTLLAKAYGATDQPYQTYGAPRIAGFAPEQEQAFGMVGQNVGNWQPALDAATTSAGMGVRNWTDPGVASSYMNPYEDAVVDDIGTLAARNLSEKLLPQVNRTFIGGGTFGGSRSADFTGRAVRDAGELALREQNRLRQEGYNTSAGIFDKDSSRAIQGAQAQAGIGSTTANLAYRDAAQLEAVGGQRQALAQTSANTAYGDFERQRDWELTQAQRLGGIGGQPSAGGSGTESVNKPGPNTTAQTIGAINAGIGPIGKLFGDKRNGGRVRGIGRMNRG